jgi:dTDP-4-dehydrorhamnose reductase
MTEKPFIHKKAFANVKSSFIYHEDVRKLLFKLLNKKGILNIGGKAQYIYNFAKKSNKKVKREYLKKNSNHNIPFNSSLNILNLNKFLKKKKIID